MITDIITAAIANLATNPANRPIFCLGTKAYQNILADSLENRNFVIYLEQPIPFIDSVNAETGYVETTYQCSFTIAQKIKFDSLGTQQQNICDIAQTIKHYFLQALLKDERIKSIQNSKGIESINEFDLNASGIMWMAAITIYNKLPNCIPADNFFPINESGS